MAETKNSFFFVKNSKYISNGSPVQCCEEGVLLDIKLSGHFLAVATADLSNGNEHEAHRLPGVDELQGAVVGSSRFGLVTVMYWKNLKLMVPFVPENAGNCTALTVIFGGLD
ncbi:Uncharacterized protein Fot_23610 [Forsythia ovata]|uniref:Uncharacterized protein n=1 Tax=Forsythia ovata TaxID=205694 RepID=A0ABD1V123_9LAMI